jgi:hypothetical protein
VATIYSPKYYYERVRRFLKSFNGSGAAGDNLTLTNILAFFKSVVRLGIIGRERRYYWRLLFWSLFRRPAMFATAVRLSIYGYHFRKVYENFSLT